MYDACLWLGRPWLGLGFSLALTIRMWVVGHFLCFSVVVRCVGWKASVRAERFLCFNGSRIYGGGGGELSDIIIFEK